ncbi:MAG: hypothetical protein ACI93R_001268 [Flavobacteriales bacterium]|jgi:hypothetical protein
MLTSFGVRELSLKKVLLFALGNIVIISAISCGATLYGFNKGMEYANISSTISMGALGTVYATKIKSGEVKDLESAVSYLEYYMDSGLSLYSYYVDDGSRLWGRFYDKEFESEINRNVVLISNYRAENPEDPIMKDIYPIDYETRQRTIAKMKMK